MDKAGGFGPVETGDVMAVAACGVSGEHLLQFCDNNVIIRSVMRNSLRDVVGEQGVGCHLQSLALLALAFQSLSCYLSLPRFHFSLCLSLNFEVGALALLEELLGE